MPKPISTTLASLLESCITQSTVRIALRDGTTKYFCTGGESLVIDGITYEPKLLRIGELKDTFGQAINRVSVSVTNTDDVFGQEILPRKLELANAVIGRIYIDSRNPAVYQWEHFFTGKAVNAPINETVTFDVISDTTAAGTCIAVETLSPRNGWVFPEVPDLIPPGGGGDDGGGIGGGRCFTGETLLTGDGGTFQIRNAQIGMTVTAFDEKTRKAGLCLITNVMKHEAVSFLRVEFENGQVLNITPEHLVYTGDGFDSIGKLTTENWLFSGEDFLVTPITAIYEVTLDEPIFVYNITTEMRTYFANGLAVHNRKDDGDLIVV